MPQWLARAGSVVRRVPFTAGVVVAMLVLAVVTTALWTPLQDLPLFEQVAYGLPALEAGRWWTPVTGSFFALTPAQYLPVAGGFAVMVGFAELRLGTARTALVTVASQLVGVLGAALLLFALGRTDWGWAGQTAATLDVGFSAGAVGALTAASATLRSPWRGRLRALLGLYVVVSMLVIGVLWDLEHLLAFLYALPLGTRMACRKVRPRLPRLGRHEVRLVAATLYWISAALVVLGAAISVEGPFGRFGAPGSSAWAVALAAGLDVVIGIGLRHGRRTWWRLAVGLTLVSLSLASAAMVTVIVGGAQDVGTGMLTLALVLDLVQLGVLVAGRAAFRNPGRRGRRAGTGRIGAPSGQDDQHAARADLVAAGSPNRLSWMTTWPENRWWFAPSGRGYLAYRVHTGVAIGLADPIGPTSADRQEVLDTFIEAADDAGLVPCVFSCTSEVADHASRRGWLHVQVAEEAVIDLPTLEFRGKKWQDVRSALNQADKQGVEFRLLPLAQAPRGLQAQVRAISEQWIGDQGLPEMGFTLGGVEEARDPDVLVGLAVDADSRVHGVTSWMPVHAPGGTLTGYTLDVMRRVPDSFRYTMEFLIASACQQFKAQGLAVVSLSGAPLARAAQGDSDVDRATLDAMLEQLAEVLEPYYGFRSLTTFKGKFLPRHEPLHLVLPDEAALARVGLAIGRAYLPDATLADLAAAARAVRGARG